MSKSMKNRFNSNLKYLLKENRMTSKQLSDIIGVERRKIFSDKMPLHKIENIATLFMTHAYALMYESVKKSPKIFKNIPSEIKNDKESMQSLMHSFKIIDNYKKMKRAFIDSLIIESDPFGLNI